MTYREILAYIYALGRFGMRPGLAKIKTLLNSLGNPQDKMAVVHVAGTNGKGSTAAFLSAILAAGGYQAGLYTSPHLINFTERLKINGVEITEAEIVPLASRVIAAAPPETTFFELVTAMAYLHFADKGVGLAVMEVGMGGRFDATNAADGILSVITPVALDHCEHLGDTLSAIALEKAGIIKAGRPVVVSQQAAGVLEVLKEAAGQSGSHLYLDGKDYTSRWDADGLAYQGLHCCLSGLSPGIGGSYQATNAGLAICAAELLSQAGFPLQVQALRSGIDGACWPGRMEMLPGTPRVLLDGAHNPAGSAALAEAVAEIPRQRLLLVAGIMGDKDLEGILAPLLSLADSLYAVAPSLPRALPSAELATFCRDRGMPVVDAGSVAEGLALAQQAAGTEDLILVCGSLFTVGEARAHLLARSFEPFRG
jgi:dihydrofolate synthase/folylpolyglutamate synthase